MIGPERWDEVGVVTDRPLGQAFLSGISRVLDLEDFEGAALGVALGAADAQHLLRFTLTAPEGDLIGGYSIIVGATG